ncbi:MAG: Lrp/AsnC family transcriptional regulator [Rhodobacteraceae bacterium]|nr:Lrp/AsnC family transcriptional regulator [Paracoccaceae bacterium]
MDDFATDALDHRILQVLQRECRTPVQQIAEAVGSSPSSVWRRIRALEAAGVIVGFRARLDPARLGLREVVFLQVSLDRHSDSATAVFERRIAGEPCVLECHAVTGEHDYLLKVVSRDLRAYYAFLQALMRMPEVARTGSMVALARLKEDTSLAPDLIAEAQAAGA